MSTLKKQLHYVREELECSVTVDFSSLHAHLFSLAIPWCGRTLHWQLLLPTAPNTAPDLIFDDDWFQPLRPPLPFPHPSIPFPLSTPLRHWPSLHSRPDGLALLLTSALQAYCAAQVARLEAAAAALPRLHFELSTLGLLEPPTARTGSGTIGGVGSMGLGEGLGSAAAMRGHEWEAEAAAAVAAEGVGGLQVALEGQVACFALPLPCEDGVRRLLALALQYGSRLAAEYGDVLVADEEAKGTEGGPGGGGEGHYCSTSGSSGGMHHHHPSSLQHPQQRHQEREKHAAASRRRRQRRARSALRFVLMARFRLPAAGAGEPGGDGSGGGWAADLGIPELTLRLPPAFTSLDPPPGAPPGFCHAAPASSSFSIPTSSSPIQLLPALQLPTWSDDMCLAEYVPLAAERLGGQMNTHCSALSCRLQLFDQLTQILGPPLELCPWQGTVLFSVGWDGAPLLLGLEAGGRFPAEKPGVTLHAVRHLSAPDAGRTYRDYPWSPRWGAGEMAARLLNWLKEELPNFMWGRPTV